MLAEFYFDALALALQGHPEPSRLALAAIAQRVGRTPGNALGSLFELREQACDVLGGGF